jgi:dsDNA-specific endonuclease/ATPase MutS2
MKFCRPMCARRPVRIPIDGVLDLHAFRPADVKNLVEEYLEECRRQGIDRVRIIHGKGTGALRQTVLSLLKKNPNVLSYRVADLSGGSWGATEVVLKPGDKN